MDSLPENLVCCKKSRRARKLEAAIDQLNKETDLIEMIRQMRFVKKLIESKAQSNEEQGLFAECKYTIIDLDETKDKFLDA